MDSDQVPLDPFHRPLGVAGSAETSYLEQSVQIEETILRDGDGFAVMMPWEKPLMVREIFGRRE